jgi:hypothetical protein
MQPAISQECLSNAELDALAIRTDRAGRFTLYADLKSTSTKEWLVHKLLGHAEASVMFGKPGDGKSVLAEDMALHVAAGVPWHGRPVRRGAVLYVAMERRQLVERRAIAFRIKNAELHHLPFAITGGVLDFRDPRTVENIVSIAKEVEEQTAEPVVLIVLDTLSRGLCGGDENSPKDMGAIVASTGRLQTKTGSHVMWIHHMPQEAERMRGHGALLGAVDTTTLVGKDASARTATVVKANDSEEGESLCFTLESVCIGGQDDTETTAPIVVPAELMPKGHQTAEDRLTKNQRTVFAILHGSGERGLTTDEWNAKARDAGIGVKRRADLHDIREALKSKSLIKEFAGRWSVLHTG